MRAMSGFFALALLFSVQAPATQIDNDKLLRALARRELINCIKSGECASTQDSPAPKANSCAMTNGSDVCSATIPCCEQDAVCNSDSTGVGLCD